MRTATTSLVFLLVIFYLAVAEKTEKSQVVTITDDNYEQVFTGEWMLEFYATWCPHCRQYTATWESFADWLSDTPVKAGSVDVTEQPMIAGQFLISQLPTIYHLKDGVIREYANRDRSLTGLQDFIEKGDWSDMEPLPWFRSPSSYHMRVLGMLFSVSQHAKFIEDYLRKEYNMPTWGIFATVAGVVIFAGLMAGLMLLLSYEMCVRFICKKEGKKKPRQPRSSKPPSEASSQSEDTGAETVTSAAASSAQGEGGSVKQRKGAKKDTSKENQDAPKESQEVEEEKDK